MRAGIGRVGIVFLRAGFGRVGPDLGLVYLNALVSFYVPYT